MIFCKGKCEDYRKEITGKGQFKYLGHRKYCRVCERFIVWEGIYCPCCNMKLRQNARNKKYRKRNK